MRFVLCLTALCAVLALSASTQGATLKTLYSFCAQSNCADGSGPSASLLRDGNGNLFGTTFYGGTASGFDGGGVVFEIARGKHSTWQYSNLHTFCSQSQCADGKYSEGDVIIDTAGNLYGEADEGGSGNAGLIFELSPAGGGWTYNILHEFSGADGAIPSGGMRYVGYGTGAPYDGVSALYGLTDDGGAAGVGTAYQLMPNAGSWTLTTINSFSGSQNAYGPVQTLTLDASGTNMYGVTENPDNGAVFRLTNAGGGVWNETTLYTFDPAVNDRKYPFGAPFLDSSGALIGSVTQGGPKCTFSQHHGERRCGGGIFKLTGGSTNPTYDVIHDFCVKGADKLCQDGADPGGMLIADASGTLYGVAASGGKYQGGTVFRIRREQKLETVYDFCSLANCADGQYPSGGLTLDSKGHLYGVTISGGANGGGTVFELTP